MDESNNKKYDKKILALKERVDKLTKECAEYKFSAEHDGLTGLYNQKAAEEQIEKLTRAVKNREYAFIIFDLDSFKKANDSYGHLFGNAVLEHIADKIAVGTNDSHIAARIGGDEFIVFREYENNIEYEIRQLFEVLNCKYEGYEIKVSMGVSLYPKDGKNYRQLLCCADKAMYASKIDGKNKYRFYSESIKNILPAKVK